MWLWSYPVGDRNMYVWERMQRIIQCHCEAHKVSTKLVSLSLAAFLNFFSEDEQFGEPRYIYIWLWRLSQQY
jgi:hypothetical protein